MLKKGDVAPDFAVGESSLHRMLEKRAVVVFFFPKAFTPG
jgi:peroxiredoxin